MMFYYPKSTRRGRCSWRFIPGARGTGKPPVRFTPKGRSPGCSYIVEQTRDKHFHSTAHPIIESFEQGGEWDYAIVLLIFRQE
jgi:hypothetical protein